MRGATRLAVQAVHWQSCSRAADQVCAGRAHHAGKCYPDQRGAIVPLGSLGKVHARLAGNHRAHRGKERSRVTANLLAGMAQRGKPGVRRRTRDPAGEKPRHHSLESQPIRQSYINRRNQFAPETKATGQLRSRLDSGHSAHRTAAPSRPATLGGLSSPPEKWRPFRLGNARCDSSAKN